MKIRALPHEPNALPVPQPVARRRAAEPAEDYAQEDREHRRAQQSPRGLEGGAEEPPSHPLHRGRYPPSPGRGSGRTRARRWRSSRRSLWPAAARASPRRRPRVAPGPPHPERRINHGRRVRPHPAGADGVVEGLAARWAKSRRPWRSVTPVITHATLRTEN
jgi:hypothetical protein